jgi:hypothetical protein
MVEHIILFHYLNVSLLILLLKFHRLFVRHNLLKSNNLFARLRKSFFLIQIIFRIAFFFNQFYSF